MQVKHKRECAAVMSVLLMLSTAACGGSALIDGGNDGYQNAQNSVPEATALAVCENSAAANESEYTHLYDNEDGNVEYFLVKDAVIDDTADRMVYVSSYRFTENDAGRIAEVIFGEANYYDYRTNPQKSKTEILEDYSRWQGYLENGTIAELFFGSETIIKDYESCLEGWVDKYKDQEVENAPEEVRKNDCTWEFRSQDFYSGIESDARPMVIKAAVEDDRANYVFSVVNNITENFSVQSIHVCLNDSLSPYNIDSLVNQYRLCKGAAPTESQLESIRDRVVKILEAVGGGQWNIDVLQYDRLARGTEEAYIVTVKAIPMFEDEPVLRFKQPDNLVETWSYAQHMYFTDAEFSFTADGTILSCTVRSPMQVNKICNISEEKLSTDELKRTVDDLLIKRNISNYLECYYFSHSEIGDDGRVKVFIDNVETGLAREKTDNFEEYVYIPAIRISGHVEITDGNGETVFDSSDFYDDCTFLVISAVDGDEICYSYYGSLNANM